MSRKPEDDRKRNATNEGEEAAIKQARFAGRAGPARSGKKSPTEQDMRRMLVELQNRTDSAEKALLAEKERADSAEKAVLAERERTEKAVLVERERTKKAVLRAEKAEAYQIETSIYGLLRLAAVGGERLQLSFSGQSSSRAASSHDPAKLQRKEFLIEPNILNYLDSPIIEKLKDTSSSLLATTKNSSLRVAEQEADVQFFVNAAVQDAVVIVNLLLEAKKTSTGVRQLSIRREQSLFSNRLDHSVVFDTGDGIPVFIVEDKKPTAKGIECNQTISGQLYDYLTMASAFSGRRSIFGVLTTFEETLVSWLDDTDSNTSAEDSNRFACDKLANISKRLASTGTKITTPASKGNCMAGEDTPSPVQIVSSTDSNESGCNHEELVRFKSLPRSLMGSTKTFNANELVPVLCNAILCSLKDCAGVNQIEKIPSPMHFGPRLVLKLTIFSYEWQRATINLKSNPCPITTAIKPACFYVVDCIGHGTTSKAFRAVALWDEGTEKFGGECVVKMYVLKYDPETHRQIPHKQFMDGAKECVLAEVRMYHTIYPKLINEVWGQRLAGHWCVIMPFFEPVPKSDRLAVKEKVKEILLSKFALTKYSYRYKPSDQSWRHIGQLGDILYLFDLGDLEEVQNDNNGSHEEYVTDHWNVLDKKARTGTGQL